jgi:uncharacterized membrane protein
VSRKSKEKRRLARLAQRDNPRPVEAIPVDAVPTAQQQLLARLAVSIERFSGPLPPPEILEKYNAIEPGFANRIMHMAESQSEHRQAMERMVISSRTKSEERAQILGTILALVIGSGSIGVVALGQPIAGVATLVAELAALAGIFIYGRRKQEKESADKTKALVPAKPDS